jgi:hypothetical protein
MERSIVPLELESFWRFFRKDTPGTTGYDEGSSGAKGP